jgi:hypothetical protein
MMEFARRINEDNYGNVFCLTERPKTHVITRKDKVDFVMRQAHSSWSFRHKRNEKIDSFYVSEIAD